jgi:UPF0271 protein
VVIDLNADVGEGFSADSELVLLVTSVNVACGFHAGDAQTMRSVCTAAVAAGASIGAHVSYRDRDGFGRRALPIDADIVLAEVGEQIEALQAAATSAGGRVSYVKPHGALYHRASSDAECAAALVAAAAGATAGRIAMLGFPGSSLLAVARSRLRRRRDAAAALGARVDARGRRCRTAGHDPRSRMPRP